MSLQFSRSLRSLRLDSYRAARIGLVLAILIMLALIVWFFIARVTIYEISSDVKFTQDGTLIAEFSEDAMTRIRTGQAAILRIEAGPDQSTQTIPALTIETERGGTQAEFLIMAPDFSLEALEEGFVGQVQVEVEYITPAELVLRTSGKFLNQGELPLSPQVYQENER